MNPSAADEVVWARTTRWIDDGRSAWLLSLMTWTLVILMIVPDGFNYGDLSDAAGPASGGAISRMLWLLLLAAGLLVMITRSALAFLLMRWLNPFLLAFAVLAAMSMVWSYDPAVTVRRMTRVATILIDACAFVLMAWHPRRFQTVLRPILTIMLAGSIAFGLAFPLLAIHQESSAELVGAWRGLTNHKNSLGALSCITLILWFHALLSQQVRSIPGIAGIVLAATCLVLARSSTSLVTAGFVCCFLIMFMRMPSSWRRFAPFLITVFVVLLLTYSLAILRLVPGLDLLLTPITAITGKDLTFTGRSEIWAIVIEHANLHPWLGSGFGAYWTGPIAGTPAFDFVLRMHFYPGSAHNGYLEIMNDLGIAGLLCLFGYLITYVLQSLQLLRVDRSQGVLFLALFLQQGITNLSETHWLSVMSVDFVIMTLATASLARALLEQRLRAYFGRPVARHLTTLQNPPLVRAESRGDFDAAR